MEREELNQESTADLVQRAAQQTSELVRQEMTPQHAGESVREDVDYLKERTSR